MRSQDKKGKGRPVDWAAEVGQEERALEVLIGMTGKTLCRRSNSHLENALLLVEVSLGHASLHWGMLVEQHHAKKTAAAEAKKAAEAAKEAAKEAEAKKAAEADSKAQSEQQGQASTADATPSDTAAQSSQPAAGPSGVSDPAQQSTADGKASQPSSTAGAATATATAKSEAATTATASASGATSSGQAAAADAPVPELNEQDNPGLVIQSLPEHLLKQLARLLGQSGLSELAQKRCASVIRMLVETCPQLKPLMLSELQNELQRYATALPCTSSMLHRFVYNIPVAHANLSCSSLSCYTPVASDMMSACES